MGATYPKSSPKFRTNLQTKEKKIELIYSIEQIITGKTTEIVNPKAAYYCKFGLNAKFHIFFSIFFWGGGVFSESKEKEHGHSPQQ